MPNPHNVESPVTLVAFGRSGTSAIANAFERHPDFNYVGETANLIYGAWYAVEFSNSVIPPLVESGSWVPDDVRAGRVVRQTMLTAVPTNRPRWFHKPLGVPVAIHQVFTEDQWEEAATWYWKVMRTSFPRSRYFTVLRNPFDVILSARAYWGYDETILWWSLGLMSYLLVHADSPVNYAVSYDDLVREPRATVESLFDFLEVPFHDDVLEAFSRVHAPALGRDKLTPDGMTRRHEWATLDRAAAPARFLDSIVTLFDRFGVNLEMPETFLRTAGSTTHDTPAAGVVPDGVHTDQTSVVARLQQTIDALNLKIERIHVEYRNSFQNGKEREYRDIWLQQKAWIAELEKANAWLVEENARLKAYAERKRHWWTRLSDGRATTTRRQ